MSGEGIEMELHEGREIRRDGAHGRGSRRVAAAEEEINGLPAVKASSVETSDMNKDESQELVVLHLTLPFFVLLLPFLLLSLSLFIANRGLFHHCRRLDGKSF